MLQIPVPPVPPAPPSAPVVVMSGGGTDPAVVAMVIGIMIVAFFLLRPLVRALARRLEGRGSDPATLDALDEMHVRLDDVDTLRQRVAELEERVEFTERLLSGRPEAPRIGEGR